ncbi:MAG: alpha/beta hydrolase [Parvularculaceae bacterium]
MKNALWIFGALVALLTAAFFYLRTPDTDPAAMLAKYGGADAKFADAAGGRRIHYRDQGDPADPVIVMVHGNSASLHTWEPLVERLGDDYRLISYDQPGHGLTGPSADEDYSASGLMRALDEVATAAGVDHFTLVGNSMGGWIAWRYALANPDKIDALILIDASGAPLREGEKSPPSNLGFKLLRIKWLRPLVSQITPRSIVEKSLKDSVVDDSVVTDAMVDRYWELLRYPGNRRAAGLRADIDREPQMFDRIPEITAPALILWGAEDQHIYASAAETFNERLPYSRAVVYEGVGHMPMEEAPDRTASDIRAFLEDAYPLEAEPAEEPIP